MAHRRKECHQAKLVTPDVGRLLLVLRHPYLILRWIKVVERSRVMVELIAEDENQFSNLRHSFLSDSPACFELS